MGKQTLICLRHSNFSPPFKNSPWRNTASNLVSQQNQSQSLYLLLKPADTNSCTQTAIMDPNEGSAFNVLVNFSEFLADSLLQSFKMGRKHQGKAIACSLAIHKPMHFNLFT